MATKLFAALLLISSLANAFPEMISQGYINCMSCHVSPSGGGLMNAHGKSMANEFLSARNTYETPADEADKLSRNPSAWVIGGDLRLLQLYVNQKGRSEATLIPMQASMEAAFKQTDNLTWVARFGITGRKKESTSGVEEKPKTSLFNYLPNAYGLWGQEELTIRAGRFLPFYGLNNSMHFTGARGGLGFGYADQRNTVEVAMQSEQYSLIASASGPRGEDQLGESAGMLQYQQGINGNSRIAFNYWKEGDLRELYGAWMVYSFNPDWDLSLDLNQQAMASFVKGYNFAKLRYLIHQGLYVHGVYDQAPTFNRKGVGVQYFPMTGIEVEATWLKDQGDYAYLLFHYYL